jgi:uncharacterized OB-fold protein
VKPVRDGLFGEDEHGAAYLVGGRCRTCDRPQFPLQSTCPACGGGEVDETRLSGEGSLWGWTAVTAPPPGYLGETPFGFGVVELPEGLRVISRIEETDPARLAFGMPVSLVLVELGADDAGEMLTTYSFAPSTAT